MDRQTCRNGGGNNHSWRSVLLRSHRPAKSHCRHLSELTNDISNIFRGIPQTRRFQGKWRGTGAAGEGGRNGVGVGRGGWDGARGPGWGRKCHAPHPVLWNPKYTTDSNIVQSLTAVDDCDKVHFSLLGSVAAVIRLPSSRSRLT